MRKLTSLVLLFICLNASSQTISLESGSSELHTWNSKTKKIEKSGQTQSTNYILLRGDGVTLYCAVCPIPKLEFLFTSKPSVRTLDGGLEAHVYDAVTAESKEKVTVTFTFRGNDPKTVSFLGNDVLMVYSQLKFQ